MPDDLVAACNCLALRRAARRVTQLYDGVLAPSGVNATQFPVLALLDGLGSASMGEVARWLGMDRATLGHNLRPMLAQGWVAMTVGTDKRRREVALAPAGRAVLRAAMPLWWQAQRQFEAGFGGAEALALRGALSRAAEVAAESVHASPA